MQELVAVLNCGFSARCEMLVCPKNYLEMSAVQDRLFCMDSVGFLSLFMKIPGSCLNLAMNSCCVNLYSSLFTAIQLLRAALCPVATASQNKAQMCHTYPAVFWNVKNSNLTRSTSCLCLFQITNHLIYFNEIWYESYIIAGHADSVICNFP